MASVKEVVELADVAKFLKEADKESTLKMCHNATVWLAVQIKKAGILDYNIYMCSGDYEGLDHSWIVIENTDTGKNIVVDMTLNQFIDCEVPFVGELDQRYNPYDFISLCENSKAIKDFVESLGS